MCFCLTSIFLDGGASQLQGLELNVLCQYCVFLYEVSAYDSLCGPQTHERNWIAVDIHPKLQER